MMEYIPTRHISRFKKIERLTGKTSADLLFTKGKTLFEFPFKVFYAPSASIEQQINKILITVPKKIYKRAVDRNRLKRLIREAYRKNKIILDTIQNKYQIAFVYIAKEKLTQAEIEKKLHLVLVKLVAKNSTFTQENI